MKPDIEEYLEVLKDNLEKVQENYDDTYVQLEFYKNIGQLLMAKKLGAITVDEFRKWYWRMNDEFERVMLHLPKTN